MEIKSLPEICMWLARILAFVFAIPLHEAAHGYVSYKMGDPTARGKGRLTLNPVKHFDVMGFLSMLIIGVGWAKPVPVNPNYYKNRRLGMAVTAFAGPLSNLLLATVSAILFKAVSYTFAFGFNTTTVNAWPPWAGAVYFTLFFFILINVSLALFNLIPIPPLDGSRILGIVLPEKAYFGIMKYERIMMLLLLASVVLLPYIVGFSPISWLIGPASEKVMDGILWLTQFVDWLFVFIYNRFL